MNTNPSQLQEEAAAWSMEENCFLRHYLETALAASSQWQPRVPEGRQGCAPWLILTYTASCWHPGSPAQTHPGTASSPHGCSCREGKSHQAGHRDLSCKPRVEAVAAARKICRFLHKLLQDLWYGEILQPKKPPCLGTHPMFPMICQQFAQLSIPETEPSSSFPGKCKLYLFQSSFSTQR